MDSQVVLHARDLLVRHGDHRAVNVSELQVRQGETVAIMGPNGAGKSTLLRVLGFLERPTSGRLVFQGEKVSYRPRELLRLHRRVAVAFDDPLLLDTDVRGNVGVGLWLRGKRDPSKVAMWMRRLGIEHLARRSARTMSGGEAQRTSLARALVLDPELLLLDEPFSALDPPTRDELLADLREIIAETGAATLFVTHDREEALYLGDRVAVMMAGRIAQIDEPERLFRAPMDEEIARFVGVATILPGIVAAVEGGLTTVEINGQRVQVAAEALPGERVLVCAPPEDVVLSRAAVGPPSMRNSLTGKVVRIVQSGLSCKVVVDCGGPVTTLVTRQSLAELGLRTGDTAVVSFKATAAHMIRRS